MLGVICVYAPMDVTEEREKNSFYEELKKFREEVASKFRPNIIIAAYFNAMLGDCKNRILTPFVGPVNLD